MAERKVCDRCGNFVDPLGSFLHVRRWQLPRFIGVVLKRKRKQEIWGDLAGSIDLCEGCTIEFFNFVKGGDNAKESKTGQSDTGNATEHLPEREGKLPSGS